MASDIQLLPQLQSVRPDEMQEYFLKTERIGFRTWSRSDLPLANDLWGDVDVGSYIGGPLSPEQVRERLAREIECMQLHKVQYWPIFLLNGDVHVGCCGLRPHDLGRLVYELGFHIRKQFWGQGIATEAARGVCRWASENLHTAGLFAGHHPQNRASKAVLQKLGFVFTHEEPYGPTGLLHPSYFLSLRNEQ